MSPSAHSGEDRRAMRVAERITLTVIASLVLFVRVGPTGESAGQFHSDAAIPIIMANASTLTTYELYYYGQDTFGSVLSLAGWVVRQLLRRPWTIELALALNILLVVWGVTASCRAVFPTDAGRADAAICASIVALCLASSIRPFLLSIAHPYAGQIAFSCLAMALLTRGFSRAGGNRRLIGFGLVAAAACWLTPVAGPALGLACVVFALASRPQRGYERVLPGVLVVCAAAAERALNAVYHQYVSTTYGWAFDELSHFSPFRPMSPDWPYFLTSSRVFFVNFRTGLSSAELAILATGAISIIILGRQLMRRVAVPSAVMCQLVAAACAAAALGTFVAVSASRWPQYGGHNYRYLTPAVAFLLLASVIALVEATRAVPWMTSRSLRRAAAGLLVLAGLSSIPSYLESRGQFSAFTDASQRMETAASSAAVIGEYLGTYVWQGLNPSLLAVPMRDEMYRTPGTLRLVDRYRTVFLCSRRHEATPILSAFDHEWRRTELAPIPSPVCELHQYARELARQSPDAADSEFIRG